MVCLLVKNNLERTVHQRNEKTVDLLYNTVSLALWVPFNEGWGQFDAIKLVTLKLG